MCLQGQGSAAQLQRTQRPLFACWPRPNYLILLAENDEGYRNLIKLVSIANTDGFYYKPRIDHDLLARHAKGLIASSACLAGEIPQLILAGKEPEAAERALLYRDIMGEGNF